MVFAIAIGWVLQAYLALKGAVVIGAAVGLLAARLVPRRGSCPVGTKTSD